MKAPQITCLVILVSSYVAYGQPPMSDVVVVEAQIKPIPNTIVLVGTVEPFRRSLVSSEVEGIVQDMPVREGDLLDAGELIVQLNDDTRRLELDEARAVYQAAQARLEQWEFELKRIERLRESQQANEKEVYDATANFKIARAELAQMEARGKRLETDLAKTGIRAPFAGYVVRRETEVGEWVSQGGAILELIDLASVLVRVNVPESALPFVRPDDTCNIFIPALKQRFPGKIWRVIRQADHNARTFPVEVIVDNPNGALASGMFARATSAAGETSDAVAVPKDAVVERDGVQYVGVVRNSPQGATGALVAVTTGADVGDWIALTSGNVQAGTNVVIRGNERMQPYPSPVRIVDEHGSPVSSGPEAKQGRDKSGRPPQSRGR